MKQEEFSLRPMTALDLPHCHELTRRLLWSHRIEDWAQAFRVSKGVVLHSDDQIVGTAVACLKGAHSSIGLITIDPDFQRRGFGRLLTAEVLGMATDNVALVATDAGRGLYESLGFKQTGVVQQLMCYSWERSTRTRRRSATQVRKAQPQDLEDIYRLCQSASDAFSKQLMDDLLGTADAVLVASHAGAANGFCIVRPFGQGAVIGPIVADAVDVAVDLVAEAMDCVKDTDLRIDSNDIAEFDVALEPLGFRSVSRVARMGIGLPSTTPHVHRQFSLASQALL